MRYERHRRPERRSFPVPGRGHRAIWTTPAGLYLQGRRGLDGLVAARITLDEVDARYDAMQRGTEARTVIVF